MLGVGPVVGLGDGVVGWAACDALGLGVPVPPQGSWAAWVGALVFEVVAAGDDSALLDPGVGLGDPLPLAEAEPEPPVGVVVPEAGADVDADAEVEAEAEEPPVAEALAGPDELAEVEGLLEVLAGEAEAATTADDGEHDVRIAGGSVVLAATVSAVPVLETAPAEDGPGLPCPATLAPPPALFDPPVELWPENTEELTWTMASRSGGTAAATPAAKAAQPSASAGRTRKSCQLPAERQPLRARQSRSPRARRPGPRVPAAGTPTGPVVRADAAPAGAAA
jgi:hypothetical protein